MSIILINPDEFLYSLRYEKILTTVVWLIIIKIVKLVNESLAFISWLYYLFYTIMI